MNLVFLGPPGSGKGTQSLIISKDLKIPKISIGDILRKEIDANSEIGKISKAYSTQGNLVPDSLVVEIVKNRLHLPDCYNGFILDGFPRNINQAKILEAVMSDLDKKIDIVFEFGIPKEAIAKRILNRVSCKNCGAVFSGTLPVNSICKHCNSNNLEIRADDNSDTLASRIKTYEDAVEPILEFYEKKHLLFTINALKKVDVVSSEIFEVMSGVFKKINQTKK